VTGGPAADTTPQALARLDAALSRWRVALARRLELTSTDVAALIHLARHGPSSPGRLAEALSLSSSGTTTLVRRLAARDLVSHTAAARGPNAVTVSVTDHGQTALAQATAGLGLAVGGLLAGLPPAQRGAVERVLAGVADAAERDADRLVREAASATLHDAGVGRLPRWG
jgi:DNA-binding MarR family transcriptional regulator